MAVTSLEQLETVIRYFVGRNPIAVLWLFLLGRRLAPGPAHAQHTANHPQRDLQYVCPRSSALLGSCCNTGMVLIESTHVEKQ